MGSPDRRIILKGLSATPLALAAGLASAAAQAPGKAKAVADFPDPEKFEAGDLVWPKKKGSFVPQTRSAGPPNAERRAWDAARRQALADPAAAGLTPEMAEKLKTMSFEEFVRLYHTGAPPPPAPGDPPSTRGALGDTISVGHVGIIEVAANGIAYVIEATPQGPSGASGVIRTRYSDWLQAYANIQVWHGRMRALDSSVRRRMLEKASVQLGKPYDFFNFNLNDDRGFYCSKLVWQSLWRAASIAADDNPDPNRGSRFPPWFSPKTLIGVKRVEVLHKPGEY